MSQPAVSRALSPLIQSGQVQRVGAARSQRDVLARTVPGVGRVFLEARDFWARPPQPTAATLPEWAQAKTLAAAFWQAAADDARVSDGFRAIAVDNL